jgi:hypothetical protein
MSDVFGVSARRGGGGSFSPRRIEPQLGSTRWAFPPGGTTR